MAQRTRRILKELEESKNDEVNSKVSIKTLSESDLSHLLGTIQGPEDSLYEGGTYQVDIQIPAEYPFRPPKMRFITKIYHPNISSQTGAICLDILKDKWSPIQTIQSTLLSLLSLLQSPEPNDPQDAEVAKHYLSDRESYERTVRFWAERYAGKPIDLANGDDKCDVDVQLYGIDGESVRELTDMGFEKKSVIDAMRATQLRTLKGNPDAVSRITEYLLNHSNA